MKQKNKERVSQHIKQYFKILGAHWKEHHLEEQDVLASILISMIHKIWKPSLMLYNIKTHYEWRLKQGYLLRSQSRWLNWNWYSLLESASFLLNEDTVRWLQERWRSWDLSLSQFHTLSDTARSEAKGFTTLSTAFSLSFLFKSVLTPLPTPMR